MRHGDDETRPQAPERDFDLLLRNGMEVVATAEARLRHPAAADGLKRADRLSLMTFALETATALQLLRAARDGDLSPDLAERERCRLLERMESSLGSSLGGALGSTLCDPCGGATLLPPLAPSRIDALPMLLHLPLRQLATLWADITPLLAAPTAMQRQKPRQRPFGRPRLHLVGSPDIP